MARRGVIVTLLLIVAAQLAGGIFFATISLEPCPDDTPGKPCPPVCSFCAQCAHMQQAIVRAAVMPVVLAASPQVFAAGLAAASSPVASDIFHVPLAG
jgi:hypothetical protein